jgi:hypothetical protein
MMLTPLVEFTRGSISLNISLGNFVSEKQNYETDIEIKANYSLTVSFINQMFSSVEYL